MSTQTNMTQEQLMALLNQQQAAMAELKRQLKAVQQAKRVKTIKELKVSKNGAINFGGVRKGFPISLFHDELKLIVEAYNSGKIDEWIATNPTNAETGKGVAIKEQDLPDFSAEESEVA
jgi:hypothetical protein